MAIFSRNCFNFKYKTSFDQEHFETLDFLNTKSIKNGIEKPPERTQNRGIDESRKNTIISTLKPIISETRMQFWRDIDVHCEASEDELDD